MRTSKLVTTGLGAAMVIAAGALITQHNQLVAQAEQLTAQGYRLESQTEELRTQTGRLQAQTERLVNVSMQPPQLASQSELPVVVVTSARYSGSR